MHKVDLPLTDLPTREQWVEKSKMKGAIGYHAQYTIARLDRAATALEHAADKAQVAQEAAG